MKVEIQKLAGDVLESSELVKAVQRVKETKATSVLFGSDVRPVNQDEADTLVQNGCYSPDWKEIFVPKEGVNIHRIYNSVFMGKCVLGTYKEEVKVSAGVVLPSGIYNSLLMNSEVGDNALVYNVAILGNYVVDSFAEQTK